VKEEEAEKLSCVFCEFLSLERERDKKWHHQTGTGQASSSPSLATTSSGNNTPMTSTLILLAPLTPPLLFPLVRTDSFSIHMNFSLSGFNLSLSILGFMSYPPL